jgi:hypothetical protein
MNRYSSVNMGLGYELDSRGFIVRFAEGETDSPLLSSVLSCPVPSRPVLFSPSPSPLPLTPFLFPLHFSSLLFSLLFSSLLFSVQTGYGAHPV